MRRYDFPTAPVIIGMILGPLAEQEFRRAMTISQGDPSVFFTHPLSRRCCSPSPRSRSPLRNLYRF